jgi:membrane protein
LAAIRHVLLHRLRAFLMLLSLGLLFIAALAANTINTAIRSQAAVVPEGMLLWRLIEFLSSVAISWMVFALIYKAVPRVRVRWSEAAQGAAVAAALWELSRQLAAALVISERYNVYGIVGSIIVLLLWVYLSSNILFLGAEYVQVIRQERQDKQS